jgi:hypothetical protein
VARAVVADRPLHEAPIEPLSRPSCSSVDCANGGRRFSLGAPPGAQFIAQSYFGDIFLPPSGPRLTSSTRAAQFDKLTRRGKVLDMSWIARDGVYSIPETRAAVTQQIFRAGRARIIVEATMGKPIGEAGSCATARREWADHHDTKPS